MTSVKVAT